MGIGETADLSSYFRGSLNSVEFKNRHISWLGSWESGVYLRKHWAADRGTCRNGCQFIAEHSHNHIPQALFKLRHAN